MLNSQEATPLYQKLRDILRKQVEDGRYLPDHAIPSERDLCQQYQISRITVRQAIAEMINEGILYRKQGKGTFVARRKVNQGLSRIVTFSRTVMDIGMKPSTRILFHGLLPAGLEVASILKLPDAGQVLKMVLLGQGDDHPLVVYESYFPPRVGKKMLKEATTREKQGLPFSSYDLYGRNTGLYPARVSQTLEAVAADNLQARMLEVPKATALLRVTSIFTTRDHSPLELRRALYRGDYYKFNVVRDLA
ncbi:MAG: GntR family transcriptional regulator [Deltaproteobacteria bacterium]|nr:GntR family transcriptional regulator [Deltaproteobacteria bacterium]